MSFSQRVFTDPGIDVLLNRVTATPNIADPYRRHHPGARRTHASESTNQALDKGTLTRACMLPSGEFIYMAPGEGDIEPGHQADTYRPGSGIYRPTTATPVGTERSYASTPRTAPFITHGTNGFEPLERCSANPNPTLHAREQWAFPATDRLSRMSLRADPVNRLFPHAAVNVETANVSFLDMKSWGLDRLKS